LDDRRQTVLQYHVTIEFAPVRVVLNAFTGNTATLLATACVAGRYFAETSATDAPVTPLTPVTLDATGMPPS
ncbi:MAG: hypothetical protein RDU30_18555, partial [Desulfovibrionaceae bacterium]|nr:hypothetical protein [Desulfovibrionaceae bacterium]